MREKTDRFMILVFSLMNQVEPSDHSKKRKS